MKKLNEYVIVNGKPEKVYSTRPTKIINEEIIRLNELAGLKEAEEEENPNWTAGIDPETGKPATREEIEAKKKVTPEDVKEMQKNSPKENEELKQKANSEEKVVEIFDYMMKNAIGKNIQYLAADLYNIFKGNRSVYKEGINIINKLATENIDMETDEKYLAGLFNELIKKQITSWAWSDIWPKAKNKRVEFYQKVSALDDKAKAMIVRYLTTFFQNPSKAEAVTRSYGEGGGKKAPWLKHGLLKFNS